MNGMSDKIYKFRIENIKSGDTWAEMMYALRFDDFKKNHSSLNDDEMYDLFYNTEISTRFRYGDFGSLEIVVDESLNIIGGKVLVND